MTTEEYNARSEDLSTKLADAEQLEKYDDQISILKELINLSKAANNTRDAFNYVMELLRVEVFETSRCIESFPAFTWVLDTFDTNPTTCEYEESDFLWEYKWMISSAIDNSNISIEQLNNILEDFKTRLERNKLSMLPYYSLKRLMAQASNRMDEAEEYLALTKKSKRDYMADCLACEIDSEVSFYIEKKDLEKALFVGDSLIKGKRSCHSVPLATFCSFTDAFHKAGDKEKADEFFKKAQKELSKKENESNISDVSQLINYLVSVDIEEAWTFFEKYVDKNINSEERIEMDFSKDMLALLKGTGTRQMKVSSKVPWYNESGVYNIEDLYNYYYSRAKELAMAFDKRDGISYNMDELAKAAK